MADADFQRTRGVLHCTGIDALRGLAVLLVVLHHIHLRFLLNAVEVRQLLPPAVARVLFWSGYYAVIAFFVISGFLITRLSLARWGSLQKIEVLQFYRLRVARIWPCLLLLLAVLSALHLAEVPGFVIDAERASLPRALFAALALHFNWLEGSRGYLPGAWDVLWSLSVEESFYLLFPLLCVAVRREWVLLLVVAVLGIAGPLNRASITVEPWDSYAYLSCMDAIAIGCLAAVMMQKRRLDNSTALRWLLAGGVLAISLVVVFRQTTSALGLARSGLNVTVLALGVAAVLVAVSCEVGNATLSRFTGWLQALGRHSYEIYLTHMFVVLGAVQLFKALQPPATSLAAWYVAMLLASIALGWVLSRFYSAPLNRAWRGPMLAGSLQPAAHATGGVSVR